MSSCAGVYEGGGVISVPFSGECGGRGTIPWHPSCLSSVQLCLTNEEYESPVKMTLNQQTAFFFLPRLNHVFVTARSGDLWGNSWFWVLFAPLKPCIKPILAICGWFDHGLLACIFLLVCIMTTPSFLCTGTHHSTVLMCVFCVLKFKKCDLCRH